MKRSNALLLRTVSVVAVGVAFAAHAFAVSAQDLVEKADVVAVGKAISTAKAGRLVTFQLEVEQTLKGSVAQRALLSTQWDSNTDTAIWKYPPAQKKGVWFLREIAEGRWECLPVDPSVGLLAFPLPERGLPPALMHEDSIGIVDEIILQAAAAGLEDSSNEYSPLPRLAAFAAADYDSPAVRKTFRSFMQAGSVKLKVLGLAELVKRGDIAVLQTLDKEIGSLPPSTDIRQIVVYLSMCRSRDQDAVRALGRLAVTESQIMGVRQSAAQALSAVHTRDALPFLATLLDGQDARLRQAGVVGLSLFANGSPMVTPQGMPGLDHLNKAMPTQYSTAETKEYWGYDPTREGEYVSFWKNWWLKHQAELN